MDEKRRSSMRRLRILVPTVVVLVTIILAGFQYSGFHVKNIWSEEELYAGAEPNIELEPGHGPLAHLDAERNDITIRLHPGQHVHRLAKTIELDWEITKDYRRPDGVSKALYLINGDFPEPLVECRSGDTLAITIHNQLEDTEGLAIHFHGLRIVSEMDGVAGLTQRAVLPGESFIYRFTIPEDQYGTFWYHGHSEIQRADGLFGPMIVHKPATEPGGQSDSDEDEDHVLLVGDWYHPPAEEVLESYTDWKMFKIEPSPDSMLLNGLGHFDCSKATKNRPVDCEETMIPHLSLPDNLKLRIVNTGALTGLVVSISGYNMTLTQVDGGSRVQEVSGSKLGILYPGERVDVILVRYQDAKPEDCWIQIDLDRENMQFPNLALTPEQRFPIKMSSGSAKVLPVPTEARISSAAKIDLSAIRGDPQRNLPQSVKTVLLYATISYLTQYEYRPKGFFNHTSWMPSNLTTRPLLELHRSKWPTDPEPLVVDVKKDDWVDIVINNIDDKGHPFHLHGHDFFVLAVHRPSRPGAFESYNPFDPGNDPSRVKLNLETPLKKDTVFVPRSGYTVLRFQADNVGLWLLHCHVLWHEAVGMNMVFQVSSNAGLAVVG